MSHFGELVDDNKDSIIATLGLWKSSHKVLGNAAENKKFPTYASAQDHYGDCIQGLIFFVTNFELQRKRVDVDHT